MRFISYIILFHLFSTSVFGQARIVINDNAYIRLNGGTAGTPIYVVVDNGNANAVTTSGTGGNWVSEGEWNILKWNIGTNTGTYVIPYTSNPATTNFKFPLTTQITVAGTGAGYINYSTYETTTDMNIPWASLVTHMTDADNPPADNSLKVADRYWINAATGYATKPDVNFSFGYVDNVSELGGTNSIVEVNLVAQRWNTSGNVWEGNFTNTAIMYGTANIATNQVTGVDIPPSEFHEVWVLVDNSSLLPVEMVRFNGNCVNNKVVLVWSTASELNTQKFVIEKSINGIDFSSIGEVMAAGNSNQLINYSFTDASSSIDAYYRIKQMDNNGQFENFPPVFLTSCSEISNNVNVYSSNDQVVINYFSNEDEQLIIELYSADGKLVLQEEKNISNGFNQIQLSPAVATGVYLITVKNQNEVYNQKIYLNK